MRFIKNHVGSLIAWILIVVISIFMLPNVNQLTREHSTISLPANVQSEVASTIGNHWDIIKTIPIKLSPFLTIKTVRCPNRIKKALIRRFAI